MCLVRAVEHPSLARACALHNAANYDGAIAAAAIARNDPARRSVCLP